MTPSMPAPAATTQPRTGTGVPADEFRGALANLTTAVSIVTTDGPAGRAGLTCSAVFPISDDPATVAVCVHRKGAANAAIFENRVLCVSCLRREQRDLSQLFAGAGSVPMRERFSGHEWHPLHTGAPGNRDALVSIDCEVVEKLDVGTHSLFIARVVSIVQGDRAEPLVYFRRTYATAHPI